ncbi:Calreticulin-1 [Rhizophlyctis rosea]|uniref:Calreticulin n=1 Tax=Rhizophlyctis rosea TaxID=64517 RepID=A0AAD5SJJ2_9FUNG|nr:Calreticulin-1 [Rhizophlyctis rosea]
MKLSLAFASLLAVPAMVAAKTYFKETFDDKSWESRWVQSTHKEDYGKFKVSPGKFYADKKGSRGLQTSEDAKFYALTAPFDEVLDNSDKPLVVQFTVKFEQNIDCGGGYVKLLPPGTDPKTVHGETPYNIMFGPDICGSSKKTHVILNHDGKNHDNTEQFLPLSDQLTHLHRLTLNPDGTYEILNDEEKHNGTIFNHWNILPPKKIKDPKASKPEDWVDKEFIADPEDTKPSDWDDAPEYIADPDAKKPEDWDDDMDGEWEVPKIKNPDYKGEWKAKQIKNPNYKGPWVHPEIDNPEYKEDASIGKYKSAYIAFDLWQVKSGTIFDDIIVTDSVEEAEAFAKETFLKKQPKEKAEKDKLDEEERKKMEAEAAKAAKEAEEKEKEEKAKEKEEEKEEVEAQEAEEAKEEEEGHDEL